VQRNAAAFRGDPARVMLFGESAGAVNTCALLASPQAAGLFSRAAVESGSCIAVQTAEVARAQGQRFAHGHELRDRPRRARARACARSRWTQVLRALPAPVSISGLDAAMTARWGPVVAGPTLPERPYDAMLAGRQNRVPLMVGHNTEEVGLTVPAIPTEEAYRAGARLQRGRRDARAERHRRRSTPWRATARRAPRWCRCSPTRASAARRGRRRGPTCAAAAPTWRYLFAQPLESGHRPPCARSARGTASSSLYVFQNIDRFGDAAAANDLAVERAILGYWTRFAATGVDPKAPDDPVARYGFRRAHAAHRSPRPLVERGWRNAECDGWDTVLMITPPAP
jgi:para-nitrobenzyl esterase